MIKSIVFLCFAICNILYNVTAERVLKVIAGSGSFAATNGDGVAATLAWFPFPIAVFASTTGNVFIADQGTYYVSHVDTTGIRHNIVGTGSSANPDVVTPDGTGTSVALYSPGSVVGDSDGRFLFIGDNYRIWKYDILSGMIAKYAGLDTKTDFSSGDGGPATSASIAALQSVWLTTDGILYLGSASYTVRKVTPDGSIFNVAGSGSGGLGGDGEPALSTNVKFSLIAGVYVDTTGVLFICDPSNNRLRFVNTAGLLNTYAGGGGLTGEGVDASNALLVVPYDVKGDRYGNLYVSDSSLCKIFKIDVNRKIHTYIGTGQRADSPVMPIAALTDPIGAPMGLSYDDVNDILYFCEINSHIVKRTIDISNPTTLPSALPSSLPSSRPSNYPTLQPTTVPSVIPSCSPTSPTSSPSSQPTSSPSVFDGSESSASSSDNSSLTGMQMIGVVLGGVVGAGLLVFLLICVLYRRDQRFRKVPIEEGNDDQIKDKSENRIVPLSVNDVISV
jgi:hypothetical protein